LLLSLPCLISCTLTKRKYTGGYYVNWHSKAPEARVLNPIQNKHTIPDKITQTNSPLIKTEAIQQPEKTVPQKLNHVQKYSPTVKEVVKNISSSVVPTYPTIPENEMPKHTAKTEHTALSSAPIFGTLSVSAALLSFIGDSAVFFSRGAAGALILFPIILILLAIFLACLSLYKARKILLEMKGNPSSGGNGWVVLGKFLAIVGLIIVAISLFFLIAVSL
jgi:hypothetical protein